MQTNRIRKVYDAYDNGKYITTGTAHDISAVFGIRRGTVSNIVRLGHKRYRIIEIGRSEPVYALYDYDRFVDTGTIEYLAPLANMTIENLKLRQFDSYKKKRNFRYTLHLLEGEHEMVRNKIDYKRTVYEVIRDYESTIGTPEEIAEQLNVGLRFAASNGRKVGYRHAQIKAVMQDTMETLYGTVDEVADFIGVTPRQIQRVLNNNHRPEKYEVSATGKYVVEIIGEQRKKTEKPNTGYVSVEPVYSHKPVPMSRYAQELFEWSTKHLRRDA